MVCLQYPQAGTPQDQLQMLHLDVLDQKKTFFVNLGNLANLSDNAKCAAKR